ncbi:MAG: hypothetical protein ABSF16_16325 [Terracidiphilus sp.]|jgi:hypothetical protein
MKQIITICMSFLAWALPVYAIPMQTYPAPGPGRNANTPRIRNSNLTTGTTTPLAVSMPSGAQVGDLTVCVVAAENTITTTPTGWTLVHAASQSYYNQAFEYKTLTSADISGGASFPTTITGGDIIVVCIDFSNDGAGYTTGNYASTGNPTSTATSMTAPTLASGGSPQAGDIVIWAAANRANGTNSLSRGTLLQAGTVGSADSLAVYYEVLAPGFSTTVTYYYPGNYNPEGNYSGWMDISK